MLVIGSASAVATKPAGAMLATSALQIAPWPLAHPVEASASASVMPFRARHADCRPTHPARAPPAPGRPLQLSALPRNRARACRPPRIPLPGRGPWAASSGKAFLNPSIPCVAFTVITAILFGMGPGRGRWSRPACKAKCGFGWFKSSSETESACSKLGTQGSFAAGVRVEGRYAAGGIQAVLSSSDGVRGTLQPLDDGPAARAVGRLDPVQ